MSIRELLVAVGVLIMFVCVLIVVVEGMLPEPPQEIFYSPIM